MINLPKRSHPKLSILNDFSLDAPLIAVAWQIVAAHSISVELNVFHHLILGVCVWLSYSADRFSEPSLPSARSARRYETFKNHRIPFLIFWSVCLLSIVCCAGKYLDSNCILLGLPLVVLCLGNFFLCRLENSLGSSSLFSKEYRTSFILSLGCLFFPAYESSGPLIELMLCWLVLFFLFFINCLSVSKWEWVKDEARASLSSLQKKPELLKAFSSLKYLIALILLIVVLRDGGGLSISMHMLWVISFVILLDFFCSSADGKRELIDLGYWFLPLTLLGIEYVNWI